MISMEKYTISLSNISMMVWDISSYEKKNCLPIGVEMYRPQNILLKYKSIRYIIAVNIINKIVYKCFVFV